MHNIFEDSVSIEVIRSRNVVFLLHCLQHSKIHKSLLVITVLTFLAIIEIHPFFVREITADIQNTRMLSIRIVTSKYGIITVSYDREILKDLGEWSQWMSNCFKELPYLFILTPINILLVPFLQIRDASMKNESHVQCENDTLIIMVLPLLEVLSFLVSTETLILYLFFFSLFLYFLILSDGWQVWLGRVGSKRYNIWPAYDGWLHCRSIRTHCFLSYWYFTSITYELHDDQTNLQAFTSPIHTTKTQFAQNCFKRVLLVLAAHH